MNTAYFRKINCYLVSMSLLTVPCMTTVRALDVDPNHGHEGESTAETYTLDDGTVIVYDNFCMNGGVDWEGIESESQISSLPVNAHPSAFLMSSSSIPESVEITVPFQTQQNNYYCGPAAARMVLGAIGYTRSQDYLASLLGTTASGGTPAGNSVANALNSVCNGSGFWFTWEWHTSRDYDTIRGHVTEAISYGNPLMVNTWESDGDCYIQGHEGYDPLFHFGVVADYFDYGNEVTYTDPGAGLIPGFIIDQRLSIENLSKACGGRGYAW